jgi:hypothetical protein
MRKTILTFLFVFLLSLTFSLAVTIDFTPTDYSSGEEATFNINCDGNSVLNIYNAKEPVPDLVIVSQGNNQWDYVYSTTSDTTSDGKYTVYVSCSDGTTLEKSFCVDSPGCVVDDSQDSTPQTPSGGGGSYCSSKWECGTWSLCNATLEQTRTCVDKNKCDKPKKEVQSCDECKESWFCSLWNDCSNGIQKRTCVDDHSCGTTFKKPLLQKNCNQVTIPGPQPQQIQPDLPPPPIEPQLQQPSVSFWNQYKTYLIGIPSVLIFIVVLILVVVHFVHPHRKAYNFDELKTWIMEEKKMGTSDEGVRSILGQNTGWTDQEINKAFGELKPKAQ